MKESEAIKCNSLLKAIGFTAEPDGEVTLKRLDSEVTVKVEQTEGKKDWLELKNSNEAKNYEGHRAIYLFNIFNSTSQRTLKNHLLPREVLKYKVGTEFQAEYKNGFCKILNIGKTVNA